MKNATINTIAALLLGSAVVNADPAYTKPAGYVTHTLKAGKFNLLGLTLHEAVSTSGAFEIVNGTTLTDSNADFATSLTAGKTYILEIIENTADPSLVGSIQEITSWTATTLTTPDDLGADGLAGETASGENDGAKYQLRAAKTLQDIFGDTNTAGLQEGAAGVADLVWIPDGSGDFNKYYYAKAETFPETVEEGWKNLDGSAANQVPICYTDAFFVQRRGLTDLDLVITGSVITTNVTVAVPNNYTFISGLFPVGATIATSGLQDSLLHGFAGTADLLWIPKDDASGYDIYYYHSGSSFPEVIAEGWKLIGADSSVDQASTPLKSGMIIQRRNSTQYNAPIAPPTDYADL